jgi:hypothetical protein
MNARRISTVIWLAVGAMLWPVAGHAAGLTNELTKAVRVVNGQRVDLKPLVDWYRAKLEGRKLAESERPLKAWELVRIHRVAQSGSVWIVDGNVDGKSETFALKNPPQGEWNEYHQLKARQTLLSTNASQLRLELRRLTAERDRAVHEVAALNSSLHKWGRMDDAQRRAMALGQAVVTLTQTFAAARAELQQIEAKGYDFKKPFDLECLALKTDGKYRGKPLYDRGVVF